MPNDAQMAKFLYTIIKQLDLKSIDWNRVAEEMQITNGHAARMRFSRFRSQCENRQPVPRGRRVQNGDTATPSPRGKRGPKAKRQKAEEDRDDEEMTSVKKEKRIKTEYMEEAGSGSASPSGSMLGFDNGNRYSMGPGEDSFEGVSPRTMPLIIPNQRGPGIQTPATTPASGSGLILKSEPRDDDGDFLSASDGDADADADADADLDTGHLGFPELTPGLENYGPSSLISSNQHLQNSHIHSHHMSSQLSLPSSAPGSQHQQHPYTTNPSTRHNLATTHASSQGHNNLNSSFLSSSVASASSSQAATDMYSSFNSFYGSDDGGGAMGLGSYLDLFNGGGSGSQHMSAGLSMGHSGHGHGQVLKAEDGRWEEFEGV